MVEVKPEKMQLVLELDKSFCVSLKTYPFIISIYPEVLLVIFIVVLIWHRLISGSGGGTEVASVRSC